MSKQTKIKLLKEGARLIRMNGYAATGLSAILKAADVPKGSFYYYFKSKEDFGLELVDYLGAQINGAFEGYLCKEYSGTTINRLKDFFSYFEEEFTTEEFPFGCPIGNLTQELAAIGENFRYKLQPVFDEMYKCVAFSLEKAEKDGEITLPFPAEEMARFIINSWQGALVALKVSNNSKPFKVFNEHIFGLLLKKKDNQ